MRSTAPRTFQPRKRSRIDAHTCPEGGDASKPGPTCDATELLGSRVKERAVQKYRRRAARTDRARSRVGRGYAALAAMPLGPPDVPRPWHGTGVGKVLFLERLARGWVKDDSAGESLSVSKLYHIRHPTRRSPAAWHVCFKYTTYDWLF